MDVGSSKGMHYHMDHCHIDQRFNGVGTIEEGLNRSFTSACWFGQTRDIRRQTGLQIFADDIFFRHSHLALS